MNLQVSNSLEILRKFLSIYQFKVISILVNNGEERAFYAKKVIELTQLIGGMPKTYEQDGKGDQAIAYLHYFANGSDWYITEKDRDGGVRQAYGYAILNGDFERTEVGYISIEELVHHGVELDLYFTPCSLAVIKAKYRSY